MKTSSKWKSKSLTKLIKKSMITMKCSTKSKWEKKIKWMIVNKLAGMQLWTKTSKSL